MLTVVSNDFAATGALPIIQQSRTTPLQTLGWPEPEALCMFNLLLEFLASEKGFACGLCLAWSLMLTIVSNDFAATGALPIIQQSRTTPLQTLGWPEPEALCMFNVQISD
jgi:hypothetical protein